MGLFVGMLILLVVGYMSFEFGKIEDRLEYITEMLKELMNEDDTSGEDKDL